MSENLGRIEDLPADYYNGLVGLNLLPLWPSLRAVLPYGRPARKTLSMLWRYSDIRPNLMRAGELTRSKKPNAAFWHSAIRVWGSTRCKRRRPSTSACN